jgi:hypothetical protein
VPAAIRKLVVQCHAEKVLARGYESNDFPPSVFEERRPQNQQLFLKAGFTKEKSRKPYKELKLTKLKNCSPT